MELSADVPFRLGRFLASMPVIAVVAVSFWLAAPIGISLVLQGPSPSRVHPLGIVNGIVTLSKFLLPVLAIPVAAYSLVLAWIYAQCGPPYQFRAAFKIAYLLGDGDHLPHLRRVFPFQSGTHAHMARRAALCGGAGGRECLGLRPPLPRHFPLRWI